MGPNPVLFFVVVGLLVLCLLVIAVYGIRRLQRRRIDVTPVREHSARPPTNYTVTHAGHSGSASGAMHATPPSGGPVPPPQQPRRGRRWGRRRRNAPPPPSGGRSDPPQGWQ